MAKRRSINRRSSRYNRFNRSSIGSAVLDPDSNFLDSEHPLWWKDLEDETIARPSLVYNQMYETDASLESNSQVLNSDIAKEWWKNLDSSSSENIGAPKIITGSPKKGSKFNIELSTSDTEDKIIVRKKKVPLRPGLRRSRRSNAFLKVMDESGDLHTTSISNKKKGLENSITKTVDKQLPTNRLINDDSSTYESLSPGSTVKSKPTIFRKRQRSRSKNVFDDLIEENKKNDSSRSIKLVEELESNKSNISRNSNIADTRQPAGNRLPSNREDDDMLNISVPKAQSTFIDSSQVMTHESNKATDESDNTSKILKTRPKLKKQLRKSRGKNIFEDILVDERSSVTDKQTLNIASRAKDMSLTRQTVAMSDSNSIMEPTTTSKDNNRRSESIDEIDQNHSTHLSISKGVLSILENNQSRKRSIRHSTETNVATPTLKEFRKPKTMFLKRMRKSLGINRFEDILAEDKDNTENQQVSVDAEAGNYNAGENVSLLKHNTDVVETGEKTNDNAAEEVANNISQKISFSSNESISTRAEEEFDDDSSNKNSRTASNIQFPRKRSSRVSVSRDMRASSKLINTLNNSAHDILNTKSVIAVDKNESSKKEQRDKNKERSEINAGIEQDIDKTNNIRQKQSLNTENLDSANIKENDETINKSMLDGSRNRIKRSSLKDTLIDVQLEKRVSNSYKDKSVNRTPRKNNDSRSSVDVHPANRKSKSIHRASTNNNDNIVAQNTEEAEAVTHITSRAIQQISSSTKPDTVTGSSRPLRLSTIDYLQASDSDETDDIEQENEILNGLQNSVTLTKNDASENARKSTPKMQTNINKFFGTKVSRTSIPQKSHSKGQPHVSGKQTFVDTAKMDEIKIKMNKIKEQEMVAMKIGAQSPRVTSISGTKRITNSPKPLKTGRKQSVKSAKSINPAYLVNGKIYKQPKLPRPKNWVTDRLYRHLWRCMEPKHKMKTRVYSERFIQQLAEVVTIITRRKKYDRYKNELNSLIKEMARLGIINTRNDFYDFCYDYLPYEFRVKAVPILLPGNEMNIPYDPKTLHTPLIET